MADSPSPPAGRRRDVVALSGLASIALLAALLLGNAALARVSARVDLTEEDLYTISPATEKVLARLTDQAEIRAYWSPEIPASANGVRRRVEGLLDEYASRSDGRLTVTWVDLSEGGAGRTEAENLHDRRNQPLPEFAIRSDEGGRLQFSKGYMGLAIRYLDQIEFVGQLADTDAERGGFAVRPSLEYEITSQLARMVRGKPPVVGLVKDSPGFSFAMHGGGGDRFSIYSALLERQLGESVRTWISLDERVPDDVAILVVAAPKEWPEKKAFHLEQFLLRGGKVLLLLDPVSFETMRGGQPTKSGLEAWLTSHGVTVSEGTLLDWKSSTSAAVIVDGEGAFAPYPYWVLTDRAFASEHPIVAPPDAEKLDRVPLYFPAEVRLDEAKQAAAGRKATVLLTTTDEGYLKPDASGLNRLLQAPPNPSSRGRHPLGVVLEGPFTSFWQGKPSPADPPPEPPKDAEDGEKPDGDAPPAPPAATPPADGTAPPETPAPPKDEAPAPAPGTPEPPKDAPPPPPPGDAPEEPKEPGSEEGSRGPRGEDGDAPPPPPSPAMADAEPPADPKPADPTPAEPKPAEPKPADAAPPGPPKPPRLDSGSGVLVVLGDAELISDEFSGYPGKDVTQGVTYYVTRSWGNRFVDNAIDWMLGDQDLAPLRGRGATPRLLQEVEPATAETIKVVNYVAIPVLVVLVGILVWVVRRYRT